ncbi:MAG: DUF2085 domain-containing protein [Clostridia bacterium]|nr:DUF2085 domain-containing protein [Clostridia bacterium]
MDIFEKLIYILGSLVCHQLPSRTLLAGDVLLPVCARDTGIYTGMFTTLVYLFFRKRSGSDKMPGIGHSILLCILMLPMIIDALTSYIGLRETDNTIRLFTGVVFGAAFPFFLLPAANFKIYEKNTKPLLNKWHEIAVVQLCAVILGLIILSGSLIHWAVISAIIMITLIFVIGRIVYTVIKRIAVRGDTFIMMATLAATTVILMIMFLVSHFILQPLKEMLVL